jgi:fructose-1,6-bisphosphatase/inositol monophosphatase family enzyme
MTKLEYDATRCRCACEHVARRIVRPLVARYYMSDALSARAKSDRSIVTAADGAIEQDIRGFLDDAFPGFGLLGEELPPVRIASEYIWTIDPLDGTEAFAAGIPLFGTLLAVIRQSRDGARTPLLGAIYMPLHDLLIIGTRSQTTMNGRIVRMSSPPETRAQLLILGDLSAIARTLSPDVQQRVLTVARQFRAAQTWGDCFGYASLLEGKAHARIEAGLGVDDIAPIEPIILGAGGAVSTLDGTSLSEALSGMRDVTDRNASFSLVCASTEALQRELIVALSATDECS